MAEMWINVNLNWDWERTFVSTVHTSSKDMCNWIFALSILTHCCLNEMVVKHLKTSNSFRERNVWYFTSNLSGVSFQWSNQLLYPECRIYASVNWVRMGSCNGLSPIWRQAITWTNVDLLPTGPLGINFTEIRIKIRTLTFKKMRLKMSFAKWRPFCSGGDVLILFRVSVAWCWKGDKPLYKSLWIRRIVSYGVTRSQQVKAIFNNS